MWQTAQMAILAVVVLIPMWIFASELGGDEFAKSAAGLAGGAVIITALRMIESRYNRRK